MVEWDEESADQAIRIEWEVYPIVSDQDFEYIGFSPRQIRLLENEADDLRYFVYVEGLRVLMEDGPGYGRGR